jgi:hypothetical protein
MLKKVFYPKRYFSQYLTFFSLIVLIGMFITVLQMTLDEDKRINLNGDIQEQSLNAYTATERTLATLASNISLQNEQSFPDINQSVQIHSESEITSTEQLFLEEDMANKKTYRFEGYSENQLKLSFQTSLVSDFYLTISTDGHTWYSRRLTQSNELVSILEEDWVAANENNSRTVFGGYIVTIESSTNLGEVTPNFSYKQTEERTVWITVKNHLNKKVLTRHAKIVNGREGANSIEVL